jgi:arylsulfatase A-like enzyme
MIVVMSDHGESLGERDVYRHASQLYNEQTHVPMIIYHPEIAPRRVSDYVSTIDLGSTILSANGITCPEQFIGVSLLPLMKGESFRRPPVYAELTKEEVSQYVMLEQQVHPEWKKYMAVSQDGFKIIFNRDVCAFELYDLKKDPKEERNLFSLMPAKADEMKKLVLQYVDIVTASRPGTADEGRYSKAGGADGDKVED